MGVGLTEMMNIHKEMLWHFYSTLEYLINLILPENIQILMAKWIFKDRLAIF
jgi:hypothetical protein